MSLYVLSDAPIVEVVNLLLQEPYTENTIAYNDNPEAYDVRTVDGVLISMDYGDSAYGPVLDTLIFVPSAITSDVVVSSPSGVCRTIMV